MIIAPRFCGPQDSGNGGYTAGLLAKQLGGSVEVTLRQPPPLGRDLVVRPVKTPLQLTEVVLGLVRAHPSAHVLARKVVHRFMRGDFLTEPDRHASRAGHSGTRARALDILASVSIPDPERVFGVLSENGTVQVPMQKTFWSAGFGMVTDQFGIPWEIHCEE